MTKCVYIYLLLKIRSAWKTIWWEWWKLTETHGGKKMYLETQGGLGFALRIFHNSLTSLYWSSRTDDPRQPLPNSCMGLRGFRNPVGKMTMLHWIPDLKKQLFSFLGGAVMLLVYEYTYSWLQENWWLPMKCFPPLR